ELGEKALDEVEPGTMLGRESEFEAAVGLIGEPSLGLFGDVRRMIVEDQLDRRMGRIGGIEELEKFDEFATAMAVPDEGVNLTGEQIDAGQQTDRAVALVLVIARRSHACQARAEGLGPWWRSPGYRASRHRRRSPPHRSVLVWRPPQSL